MQYFARQCLHCADSRSSADIPWLLVALRHRGCGEQMSYFDFLYFRGAEGDEVFAAGAGYEYVLVH